MVSLNLAPFMGSCYTRSMRIISRTSLKLFWAKHKDSEKPLKAWFADAKAVNWKSSMDIKRMYRNASFLCENRVVFNIKGNKYRLIVMINYAYAIVYIRFIGTHTECDRIDATSI